MKDSTVIVIASAAIALSAVAVFSPSRPQAQSTSGYALSATDTPAGNVWRLDRTSGKVSYCFAGGPNAPPKCTPWGE